MTQFDGHGDPMQHGVRGWDDDTEGVQYVRGPAIGVVLAVHNSDDENSMMYQIMSGDGGDVGQCSHVEARVLMVFDGAECSIELPNCIVLPPGKSSRVGPSESEPSDYSEDVPNGCTSAELEQLSASSQKVRLDRLSGDWVVLDFVGGILQIPVITRWFPNPYNRNDAAKREAGNRYVLRRNNSELLIDKNGDWHFTHRAGQYLQLKGKTITIKHRSGQTIHMDDEGVITVVDGNGNVLQMDEDGLSFTNEDVQFAATPDGFRVNTPNGKFNVVADRVNMLAKRVTASSGGGSKALLHEALLPQISSAVSALSVVNTNLLAVITALNAIVSIVPGGAAAVGTLLSTAQAALGANASTINGVASALAADATTAAFRTKVLTAE